MRIIKNCLILILYLLVISCSGESEDMIKIHDANEHKRFINILENSGIPHRVNEHGQIYYPVSYRDEITAAEESIWGMKASTKGASVNKAVSDKVSKRLSENEIPFEVFHDEDGSTFKWRTEFDDTAMQIISEVIREAEKQKQ